MEEIMEVITWNQINVHAKPVGLLNTKGFYNGIVQWVDHASREGFINRAHRQLLCCEEHLEDLLQNMERTKFVDLSSQL